MDVNHIESPNLTAQRRKQPKRNARIGERQRKIKTAIFNKGRIGNDRRVGTLSNMEDRNFAPKPGLLFAERAHDVGGSGRIGQAANDVENVQRALSPDPQSASNIVKARFDRNTSSPKADHAKKSEEALFRARCVLVFAQTGT